MYVNGTEKNTENISADFNMFVFDVLIIGNRLSMLTCVIKPNASNIKIIIQIKNDTCDILVVVSVPLFAI